MLQNSFIHCPGVARETERNIWQHNIMNWEEFQKNHHRLPLSHGKRKAMGEHLLLSMAALRSKDFAFFLERMPPQEQWRLYGMLKEKACFLDIETTGLDKNQNDITVIGLHAQGESKYFVKGKNLQDFGKEIQKYPLLVTFNGKSFDVPFIKAKFPTLSLNQVHLDLRYILKDLGYTGGLKRIEKLLGVQRGENIQEMDGFEAVRLWQKYQAGDENALKLLLEYNQADIENLKTLMDFAFVQMKNKHFLSTIN